MKLRWFGLLVLLVIAYCTYALLRPTPAVNTRQPTTTLAFKTPAGQLAWPGNQPAAVGVLNSTILDSHGSQTPVPTASVAKVITALVVLNNKPLAVGSQGPTLTLNDADVALYNKYVAADGSVVPVTSGEEISEHQALEAMLLPSANNMADSLAIWTFGSLRNYQQAATAYLKQHDLRNTIIGEDASGLSPTTKSTASDLVRLGQLAMQQPVLTDIVSKQSVNDIPNAPTTKNVNLLLGNDNVVGIKTGNSDQAGGVFLGAARTTVNGQPVTIITAIMGAPNLFSSLAQSAKLLDSAQHNFSTVAVLKAGEIVGRYQQPWGGSLVAATTKDLKPTAWNGSTVTTNVNLHAVPVSTSGGQVVGNVQIEQSTPTNTLSVPVVLKSSPQPPSVWWRLTHPF